MASKFETATDEAAVAAIAEAAARGRKSTKFCCFWEQKRLRPSLPKLKWEEYIDATVAACSTLVMCSVKPHVPNLKQSNTLF